MVHLDRELEKYLCRCTDDHLERQPDQQYLIGVLSFSCVRASYRHSVYEDFNQAESTWNNTRSRRFRYG